MARGHYDTFTLGEGANALEVGYTLTRRGKYIGIRFVGPKGNRLEKMTRCTRKDEVLRTEAGRIITRAFAAVYVDPKQVTWDEAVTEVEKTTADLRPATLLAFKKGVKQLRATLEADEKLARKPRGPADITSELASRFCRLFLSSTYSRGKSRIERKRTPVTMSYYIRSLSAVWGQFIDLGYTRENPWASVRRPELEKKEKYVPTEEDITRFFQWVHRKYPTWERLDSLLKVKLLSGCRTADLCQLKTNQLAKDSLVFRPEQTKTKTGRTVPLPKDLSETLKRLAGKGEHLWDGWNDDLRKYRPGRNPIPDQFQASTVYCVLCNLFREYSDEHPDRHRLTPHAFRRRAITVMVTATQSVDLTAQALGVNPQTARTYYLDAQRAFNTQDAFKLASPLLIPAHTNPTLNGNNPAQPGTDGNIGDAEKP